MGLIDRLMRRVRVRATGAQIVPMVPPALVQQQAAETYAPAGYAAPWSDDITRQNAAIAAAYEAEVARREALYAKGEYTPRFGKRNEDGSFDPDIAYDVQADMARDTVTWLKPLQPLLTVEERRTEATLGALTAQVRDLEYQRADKTILVPGRPSHEEVLDAAGGDATVAAQLESRLDDLFGRESESQA